MVNWKRRLAEEWTKLHFGEVKVETLGEQHIFEVHVCLSDLDPKSVRVELYADGVPGSPSVLKTMKRGPQLTGTSGDYVYTATASSDRPASHFTTRIIPHHDGVAVPLEESRILWQR